MPAAMTKRDLVDRAMGGKLEQYVLSRRESGRSWGGIAAEIHKDYDIDVTYEALRTWFKTDTPQAAS